MIGPVKSILDIICCTDELFPQTSIATQVRVIISVHEGAVGPSSVYVKVTSEHRSLADAVPVS